MTISAHQIGLIAADVISAVAIAGTFVGLLPPLAAFGAIVWYVIQIYESDTAQRWIKGHRHVLRRKRLRKKIKRD